MKSVSCFHIKERNESVERKKEFFEKAPEFRDLKKLQILNGFTNNAFEYEILELTTNK